MELEKAIVNVTTVREDNRSDLDIITANNQLAKQKNKLRLIVSAAVSIVGGLLLTWLIRITLYVSFNGMYKLFPFIIAFVIGYFISEFFVKAHFGTGNGTGETALTEHTYTYTITDSGIKAEHDYEVDQIAYTDIVSVTSNAFFFHIRTAKRKYQLAKSGFRNGSDDFERLIKAKGFTIGIEP